ncbi:MAG: hypothetical protein ACFB20_12760 [Opitutales bacterium]
MLLLRRAILLQLEAAQPASLPPETLLDGLRLAGYANLNNNRLLTELDYLGDKQLINRQAASLDPARLRFRITAQGRDYLAGEGFA